MRPFEELLEASVERHGHLCPGQVVGVRMAMLGCRLIGLDDPSSREQVKKLLVYVEMDRCTADAVALVTRSVLCPGGSRPEGAAVGGVSKDAGQRSFQGSGSACSHP